LFIVLGLPVYLILSRQKGLGMKNRRCFSAIVIAMLTIPVLPATPVIGQQRNSLATADSAHTRPLQELVNEASAHASRKIRRQETHWNRNSRLP
jgi:hypothetical protein